ncbi:MAG TPA: carboxypeptidase-like regulatory domain-containing protein, partial [Terriglobia bacterium]|nr:carboxypeptidase-like regulatory domain-containing protein [Terriglobia bacterium]
MNRLLLIVFLIPRFTALQPGTGSISGRILSADGKPSPSISVVVARVSDCCIPLNPHATTDSDGKYQLSDIPLGDYHVAVMTPGLPLTFYPGVADRKTATSVTVKSGETLTNIDFKIVAEGQIIPPPPPN